jgi:hypothetical protein
VIGGVERRTSGYRLDKVGIGQYPSAVGLEISKPGCDVLQMSSLGRLGRLKIRASYLAEIMQDAVVAIIRDVNVGKV